MWEAQVFVFFLQTFWRVNSVSNTEINFPCTVIFKQLQILSGFGGFLCFLWLSHSGSISNIFFKACLIFFPSFSKLLRLEWNNKNFLLNKAKLKVNFVFLYTNPVWPDNALFSRFWATVELHSQPTFLKKHFRRRKYLNSCFISVLFIAALVGYQDSQMNWAFTVGVQIMSAQREKNGY